jgi:hypothetical protein
MALKFLGTFPEHINGVPARDLDDSEVQAIATEWGVSLAECEGLLMRHKLYTSVPKTVAKATKVEKEGE